MASRRKKRKADFDPLGGFSLEQLLGVDPVVDLEKKQGIIGKTIGLPFKLLGAIIMLPFKLLGAVIKLPFKLIKAILPPYGSKADSA